jgi:hypothetical protein
MKEKKMTFKKIYNQVKKLLKDSPEPKYHNFYINKAMKFWMNKIFCPLCNHKEFKTYRGLAIHFGKVHKPFYYYNLSQLEEKNES